MQLAPHCHMLHVPQMQGTDPVAEPISADIGTDLTARNLGDMRAFINLADFVGALLPACGPTLFRGWAYLMTLELVAASGQRPLLSGFYRMLTVTMRLTSAAGILQMAGQYEHHRVCLSDSFVVFGRRISNAARNQYITLLSEHYFHFMWQDC